MKKRLVVATILSALAFGAAVAWSAPIAIKLPKCSGQLCQKSGCSADTLCVRGASVVTCAEVCGGN